MRWQGSRRSTNVQDYRGRRFGGGAGLGIGGTLIALAAAYFLGVDPADDPRSDRRFRTRRSRRVQIGHADRRAAASSWPPCSARPRTPGAPSSRPTARPTHRRRWCCSPDQVRSGCGVRERGRRAVLLPGRSARSTSISTSTTSSPPASRRRAISRRPTCSRTRSAITCRRCSAPRKRCAARSRALRRWKPTSCRSRWSCRRIATPACGPTTPIATRQILEAGDVEEALQAASAVGDDTIQKRTQGHVVPDSFTHGSAEQRMTWFQRGLKGTSQPATRS